MNRLDYWDGLERAAKAMLGAMNQASASSAWTNADVVEWDKFHSALVNRPRMAISDRDRIERALSVPAKESSDAP